MNMLKASNPENNVPIKTSAEKANSANYKAYFLLDRYFSAKAKKMKTSSLLDDCGKIAFLSTFRKKFNFTFIRISSF